MYVHCQLYFVFEKCQNTVLEEKTLRLLRL